MIKTKGRHISRQDNVTPRSKEGGKTKTPPYYTGKNIMAKKRVSCPECGHNFTVQFRGVRGQVAGVRSRRITENQFEHTINVPGEMVERDRYYSIPEQMFVCAGIGMCAGATFGLAISPLFEPYEPLCVLVNAGMGSTVALFLLGKERAWQLLERLPAAVNQYLSLRDKTIGGNVELTMDHRYRDGNTEAGRTINRFGELPVDVDRFNEWVQGVLLGKSLAVNKWVPKAVLFAQPEYVRLLAKMTAGGIIINQGSNKGNTLTSAGRRALSRHLVDCGITPPSPDSGEDFLKERFDQAANNNGNTPLPHPGVCVGGENAR